MSLRQTILKVAVGAVLFVAIERFCNRQTDGFRPYDVLSHVGNCDKWETPSLDPVAQHFLKQPFFYLGSGGQFYAFLSEDKKVVLKLLRHTTWELTGLKRRSIEPILNSCKIAYYQLKKETGLITAHLNKNRGEYGQVVLYDKIGARHTIDLDKTEFVLQYKAVAIFSKIDLDMKENNEEAAKHRIDALFQAVSTCSSKGIRNTDPSIHRNCGFLGDSLIYFDVGSFYLDNHVRQKDVAATQLLFMTKNLGRWIRKHQPALLPYFNQLQEVSLAR